MNRFLLASAIIGATALAAPAALAQQQTACGPRGKIVNKLSTEFNEHQQAVGYVNQKAILEVFVSAKGTWTIIASGTDGNSCLLSAGKDWDDANFVKGLDATFHHPVSFDNFDQIHAR
jgi:hypothetical protein